MANSEGFFLRILLECSRAFFTRWTAIVASIVFGLCVSVNLTVAQGTIGPCGTTTRAADVISIPANSPPTPWFYGDGADSTDVTYYQFYSLTKYNVHSQQSWITVTGTSMPYTVPVPGRSVIVFLSIDTTGFPPGTYCAQLPRSVNEVAQSLISDCPPPLYNNPSCYCPSPVGFYQHPSTYTGNLCVVNYSDALLLEVDVTASTSATLVDPVPDLVSGSAVVGVSQLQTTLTKGTVVTGVGADGTTQVVVRISTNAANEQFKVTLLNDKQTQSSLPTEDGALGSPGDTSFLASQLTVSAGNIVSNGLAYAFAIYRAPVDFARPLGSGFKSGNCNGANKTDDQLACRAVSIQIQDVTTGYNVVTLPVTILRPPVIAVHGLWADWKAWKNFSPLITGAATVDPRFYVGRVDFNDRLGTIASTSPTYQRSLSNLRANSLGIEYNAGHLADKISGALGEFKAGHNPMNIQAAAVQVDVVAHSLGGILTRQLVLLPGYLNSSNFTQGYIHKFISIDSPHLGTPLSALLLSSQHSCISGFLADFGNYSLNSITFTAGGTTPGAVTEMTGDGVNIQNASATLRTLAGPGPRPLPVALIAGNYTNWSSLGCTLCLPGRIRSKCSNDLLAQSLTTEGWPDNFGVAGSNSNDGIVGVASQLNGATSSSLLFENIAHSPGIVGALGLGFAPPSALDSYTATPSNPIANEVITLLNIPVTASPFSQNSINP